MTTPLRKWIKNELISNIPMGTIWSDTKPDAFVKLTGVSHKELLGKWFGTKTVNGADVVDFDTKGTDSRFTTCSSFLPRFATQVRIAGGMARKKHNFYTGKDDEIGLRGFQLHTERGWTPAFLGYANGGPKEGDFFQLGHGGMTDHVGIIVKIKDEFWGKVAGGAGGRGSKHDGVKRSQLEPLGGGLMGWLDVDVYFEGWNGPDLPVVADDY